MEEPMPIFKSKKSAKPTETTPRRSNVNVIKQVIDCFVIGGRVRYIIDDNDLARLEGLVIGYQINGHLIFSSSHIGYDKQEIVPGIILKLADGEETIEYVESFSLLMPSDIGEEKKLDYQTRASLGRRGPFATGKEFVVMSLNPGRENIRLNAEVKKNIILKEGIHAGHTAGQLDVLLGTVESYELRDAVRVAIQVEANVSNDTGDQSIQAVVLDISEKALRFIPNPPNETRSWLRKNANVVLTIVLLNNNQRTVLQCKILQQRGSETVAEILQIMRQGRMVPFEMIDAMELKIALLNTSEQLGNSVS